MWRDLKSGDPLENALASLIAKDWPLDLRAVTQRVIPICEWLYNRCDYRWSKNTYEEMRGWVFELREYGKIYNLPPSIPQRSLRNDAA